MAKINKSVATLASFFATTIGVGIFALPYVYSDMPIPSFAVLAGTALILTSLYTMYIDILLEKGIGLHQLPGIAGKIWGKTVKNSVAFLLIVGRLGILFLYTIILGDFGSLILSNAAGITVSPVIVGTATTLLASILITRHSASLRRIELSLSVLIIGLLCVVSVSGIIGSLSVSPGFLTDALLPDGTMWKSSFSDSLLALAKTYGVSIGALSGIASLPALKAISADRPTLLRATRVGTLIVTSIYVIFVIFILSASSTVTQDALHGLGSGIWVTLLAGAGFISVLTSLFGISNSLFEVFELDLSLPPAASWALTTFPPVILFVAGIAEFADTAALVGGVIGGTEGLIILASYLKLESSLKKLPPWKLVYSLVTAIVLGLGLFLTIIP